MFFVQKYKENTRAIMRNVDKWQLFERITYDIF